MSDEIPAAIQASLATEIDNGDASRRKPTAEVEKAVTEISRFTNHVQKESLRFVAADLFPDEQLKNKLPVEIYTLLYDDLDEETVPEDCKTLAATVFREMLYYAGIGTKKDTPEQQSRVKDLERFCKEGLDVLLPRLAQRQQKFELRQNLLRIGDDMLNQGQGVLGVVVRGFPEQELGTAHGNITSPLMLFRHLLYTTPSLLNNGPALIAELEERVNQAKERSQCSLDYAAEGSTPPVSSPPKLTDDILPHEPSTKDVPVKPTRKCRDYVSMRCVVSSLSKQCKYDMCYYLLDHFLSGVREVVPLSEAKHYKCANGDQWNVLCREVVPVSAIHNFPFFIAAVVAVLVVFAIVCIALSAIYGAKSSESKREGFNILRNNTMIVGGEPISNVFTALIRFELNVSSTANAEVCYFDCTYISPPTVSSNFSKSRTSNSMDIVSPAATTKRLLRFFEADSIDFTSLYMVGGSTLTFMTEDIGAAVELHIFNDLKKCGMFFYGTNNETYRSFELNTSNGYTANFTVPSDQIGNAYCAALVVQPSNSTVSFWYRVDGTVLSYDISDPDAVCTEVSGSCPTDSYSETCFDYFIELSFADQQMCVFLSQTMPGLNMLTAIFHTFSTFRNAKFSFPTGFGIFFVLCVILLPFIVLCSVFLCRRHKEKKTDPSSESTVSLTEGTSTSST